jgi:hypothetical protein
MEAEYNTLSITMHKLIPFKHLVTTISSIVGMGTEGPMTFKTTIWEDNSGALTWPIWSQVMRHPDQSSMQLRCIGFIVSSNPTILLLKRLNQMSNMWICSERDYK